MDHCILAQLTPSRVLLYLLDTWRFSYGQWMWKACRNEQHLLSKSQCSSWKHGLCFLYCSLTMFFQLHDVATTLVQDFYSLHDHRFWFCSSYKQVQKFERQFCSCPECWVHPICCWWCWLMVKFTGCPNTCHGMGDIANILPCRDTRRGILL